MLIRVMCLLMLVSMAACKSNKDGIIKADLSTKAQDDKEFAGVRFTVEEGTVTLSGNCATEKSKSKIESTVRKLYGVNNVINNITIAPVVIGTDQLLKQGVDSVLKEYAAVQAITIDSVVALEGKVESDKMEKLLGAINSLKPKAVENRLAIK